jgi:hypothetical protein
MARPHIEFIHAQQLPWQTNGFAAHDWPSIDVKTLSRDADNGGCSVLLRLPAGYSDAVFSLASDCEWWLLDGELALNGRSFGLDAYAFLPRGYCFRTLTTARGAVLLAFFARAPHRLAATDAPAILPGTIEHLDTLAVPWTSADIDPSVQFLKLAHKVLRYVPATGEKTILLSTGAQTYPCEFREAQLRHDCVEELYLLGGDIVGERGTMYEGAYFWRPAGRWHGPFGSRRGSLSLVRFLDGHHRNVWGDAPRTFTLEPAHSPALPPDVCPEARTAWLPPRY